jgi:acetyl-CoA C-acetyltransferase
MPTIPRLLTPSASDPRTPVVVAARRTPIGTAGRSLARLDTTDLAAPVLRSLGDAVAGLDGGGADGADVDEVVLGNCTGPGGDPARVAALAAGLGTHVPGLTVDRQCASGLEAIAVAAARVVTGARLVLAGGVESASTAPTRLALQPDGSRVPYTRARFSPDELGDPGMGEAADALAAARGVSRQRQDAYAVRSHERTLAAQDAGHFADELLPVAGVAVDDRPRRGLDIATLARFRPAFTVGGTVTAGNACGVNDGAAAVAVVDEESRAALGVPGLAIRAVAARGVDPRLPGLGPVPAVRAVLDAAGLSVDDVGTFEVTEAFAAQVLACTDELGLDPLDGDADRVCPDGGAIALGHPWGASGALLVVRLFRRILGSDVGRYGVATCAVGGGQGVAVLVERVG